MRWALSRSASRLGPVVWSPLGWGRLTGKIRRGQPLPEKSRLHDTASFGPPVEDEHLYRVVDALDAVAERLLRGRPAPAISRADAARTVAAAGGYGEERRREGGGYEQRDASGNEHGASGRKSVESPEA